MSDHTNEGPPPIAPKSQEAREEGRVVAEIVSPINGHRLQVTRNTGNSGGKKGRSGRMPGSFSDFLAGLRVDPRLHRSLRRIAGSPGSKNMGHLLKLLTRYDPDAPTSRRQVDVTVRGVVALPVMDVPQPAAGETVIDWHESAPVAPLHDHAGPAQPFLLARAAVIDALRGRRE